MPDPKAKTLGEVERAKRVDNPGGRGVPDERRGFEEEREENLAASRQEGRVAAPHGPGEEPTRGTPDATIED